MTKPPSLPASRIVVYLIEPNDLAAAYLQDVLKTDHSLATIRVEEAPSNLVPSQEHCLFVLDECGLHPPAPLYLEALRRLRPNGKSILLGKDASAVRVAELLPFGLDGFVPHREVSKSLLDAIRAVRTGKFWVAAEALEFSVRKQQRRNNGFKQSTGRITHREYEILQLVRARFTNEEIAKLVNIRESTVKFHLTNIFLKLHITNRRDLIHRPLPALFTHRNGTE
jgi:DNA-binding NarL/FixJ family response regulator